MTAEHQTYGSLFDYAPPKVDVTTTVLIQPVATCSIEQCDLPVRNRARRLCNAHYIRLMRTGTVGPSAVRVRDAEERFWAQVDKSGECWLWTGPRYARRGGYGACTGFGNNRKAHRVSYEIANGPIPDGLFVMHRCDNPPCVNPDHLFLGTNADNLADMRRKGRGFRPIGELSPSARLTAADVVEIRGRYARGEGSHASLAAMYGVSSSAISALLLRQSWRHVS